MPKQEEEHKGLAQPVFRFLCLILVLWGDSTLWAGPAAPLPLPRFASIRARKANLHVGPGVEYPTEWMYVSAGLPVEIIAQFDIWRQVRDHQGTTGWIQKGLLSGDRTAVVKKKICTAYVKPDTNTAVVAKLSQNFVVKLVECTSDWCRFKVSRPQKVEGWVRRSCLWGVYPNETTFKK